MKNKYKLIFVISTFIGSLIGANIGAHIAMNKKEKYYDYHGDITEIIREEEA